MFHHKLGSLDLALYLAHDNAQYRALPFEHSVHAPKLFGVRLALSAAAQLTTFLGKSLFKHDTRTFGHSSHFVTRNLQQAAIHEVRDDFLLHRRATITRSSSAGLTALASTAASMARRNRPICVRSQGCRCS